VKRLLNFILLFALPVITCVQITIAQDNPESGDIPRRDEPVIEVDRNELEQVLDAGQVERGVVNVSNTGDQLLRIQSELTFVDQPNIRVLNRMKILIVTEGEGVGGEHVMLEAAQAAGIDERNILEVDSRDIRDIDIYDWDVIIWSDAQNNQFYQEYNQRRERFEDWIEDGGCLILNHCGPVIQPALVIPGGVMVFCNPNIGWAQQNVREDDVDLENPIIAGFGNDEEDDVPEVIFGDECSRSFIMREFLQNNENPDDMQLIFSHADDDRFITMFTYRFGEGNVCCSALNLSGLWYSQWNENGADLIARNEIIWADWVKRIPWVTLDDHETEIDPDNSIEMTVVFNSENLVTGNYFADLHINSNDENNADIIVSIALFITETPDISVEWRHDHGFPEELNWNLSREGIYIDRQYEIQFTILNSGSGELVIDEVQIIGDGSEFLTIDVDDQVDPIDGRDELTLDLTLLPREVGDFEVMVILFSNDPDEDEFDFPIVFAVEEAPIIVVAPELIVGEFPEFAVAEHEIILRNPGRAPLQFHNEIETVSRPVRDINIRSMRSVGADRRFPHDMILPERDDPGDILHEFELENDFVIEDPFAFGIVTHGLAWDIDNEWMWAVNTIDHRMIAINPNEDYRTEEFWMLNVNRPWDLAYYDGVIYSMESSNTWLWMWDRAGNNLGRLHLDLEGSIITGVAVDPFNEWLMTTGYNVRTGRQPLSVFSIEGEPIAHIDDISVFLNHNYSGSLEWIPFHDHGRLWLKTSERLWQIEIDTENWDIIDIVQHFQTDGAHQNDGFAHDGENLWVTSMCPGSAGFGVLDYVC